MNFCSWERGNQCKRCAELPSSDVHLELNQLRGVAGRAGGTCPDLIKAQNCLGLPAAAPSSPGDLGGTCRPWRFDPIVHESCRPGCTHSLGSVGCRWAAPQNRGVPSPYPSRGGAHPHTGHCSAHISCSRLLSAAAALLPAPTPS